jgi:hypothetical protein
VLRRVHVQEVPRRLLDAQRVVIEHGHPWGDLEALGVAGDGFEISVLCDRPEGVDVQRLRLEPRDRRMAAEQRPGGMGVAVTLVVRTVDDLVSDSRFLARSL